LDDHVVSLTDSHNNLLDSTNKISTHLSEGIHKNNGEELEDEDRVSEDENKKSVKKHHKKHHKRHHKNH